MKAGYVNVGLGKYCKFSLKFQVLLSSKTVFISQLLHSLVMTVSHSSKKQCLKLWRSENIGSFTEENGDLLQQKASMQYLPLILLLRDFFMLYILTTMQFCFVSFNCMYYSPYKLFWNKQLSEWRGNPDFHFILFKLLYIHADFLSSFDKVML